MTPQPQQQPKAEAECKAKEEDEAVAEANVEVEDEGEDEECAVEGEAAAWRELAWRTHLLHPLAYVVACGGKLAGLVDHALPQAAHNHAQIGAGGGQAAGSPLLLL